MGLVQREIPFAEPERSSKKSLYKIADPFFRLWFRVVAPHRGQLAAVDRTGRLQVLQWYWNALVAQSWEDLCRMRLPRADLPGGSWGMAARWWKGNCPEWDVVSRSFDGRRLLLGEVKWSQEPMGRKEIERAVRELRAKAPPLLPKQYSEAEQRRVLFIPEHEESGPLQYGGVDIVTGADLLV